MSVREVPSDHDFFDPAYIKHWSESISRYRPERNRLFEVFAAEAARIKKGALSVFELGCGPGFLAEALLENCVIARYTVVDFSPHMLDLSHACHGSDHAMSLPLQRFRSIRLCFLALAAHFHRGNLRCKP